MKLLALIFLLACPLVATAPAATFAWDRAVSHTNLLDFVLGYGPSSGNYTNWLSVPPSITQATVTGLQPGRTYFFAVVARNMSGVESDPSNEISYTQPGGIGPTAVPGAVQQFVINKVP